MTEQLTISLLLLLLVLIDAVGDALRFRSKQIANHALEVCHIMGWISIWALFGFEPVYILLYVLGRIVLFDIAFNIVAKLSITHIGTSSLYDIILSKFGKWVKNHPIHFVFIFRFMALLAWLSIIMFN